MNDVRDSLSLAMDKLPYFACHKENDLQQLVAVPGGPLNGSFRGQNRGRLHLKRDNKKLKIVD